MVRDTGCGGQSRIRIKRENEMTLTIETLAGAIMDAWDGDEPVKDACATAARNIITAIEQAGYVVAPKDATPEMRMAGRNAALLYRGHPAQDYSVTFGPAWSAMIAAAPEIGGE